MSTKFDRISGNDEIFNNKEYIADSIIFNSIESARRESDYNIYSDHRAVILLTAKKGHKVWLWTSSAIKDDTNKLIDICRFLRDCGIPKAEIYLKHDIAQSFSDLYALTTLELNYALKDEYSLAVFTYSGNAPKEVNLESDEKIILIDKNKPELVALAREFYEQLKEEFRWTDKFERKFEEYLNLELYALVKNGKMIANAAIGSSTEKFLRIKSIAVLPQERRKGFGYKMCTFAVGKIKERDLTPILYTNVGNISAMSLWAKSEFKEYSRLYLLKIENSK